MNQEFNESTEIQRRFKALLAAFEAQHRRSPSEPEMAPTASMGDDFRAPPDPYPGLRSFTPREGGVFFGRERNVNEVRERLSALNFAIVLGGSGSGKSSLIRAGLIPRLNSTKAISGRSGNWYAAEFRPRLQPINELTKALQNIITENFSDQIGAGQEVGPAAAVSELSHEFDVKRNDSSLDDRVAEAESLSNALLSFVDNRLDQLDRVASHGLRSGKPSLLLVVDQFEEVFRPEVLADSRTGASKLLDVLIASCAKLAHMRTTTEQSGLFIVITMRSEELHRCAEHPALAVTLGEESVVHSLADVVNRGMYLLDLLDPVQDREDLRDAIVRPARRVFSDWGLPLDPDNPDAPYADGVADWLLIGAERLSCELEHRPDQLPLLQHALQTIWRGAVDDWTTTNSPISYEIRIEHLDCPLHEDKLAPDLTACLDKRADLTARQGVDQVAHALISGDLMFSPSEASSQRGSIGLTIIRAAFRALAQRDDRGNWARRFADTHLIATFLVSGSEQEVSSQQLAEGIHIALSTFVSKGYLVLKSGYYDISHEALIRNWKQYQEWLRDPQEIARALVRTVTDVNPEWLGGETPDAKDELLGSFSPSLCDTLGRILVKHELPQSWVFEQILPLANRADVSKRWRTADPAAIVDELHRLVVRAQRIRNERARARSRRKRNAWLAAAGSVAVCLIAIAAIAGFIAWRGYEATRTALITHAKMIALAADEAIDDEGPAQGLLVAMQAQKANLPDIPQTDRVIYRGLRQLRERRSFLIRKVTGAAASPSGDVIAGLTSDATIYFWHSSDGTPIDTYNVPITGPAQTLGLQWNSDGLVIGDGNLTVIVAPCSNSTLRPLFLSCVGHDQDIKKSLGTASTPAGIGKFSSDGKWLITGMWNGRARLWNVDTGENFDLGVDTTTPAAVALAPDAKFAAVGTSVSTIQIINRETGTRVLKFPENSSPGSVTALEISQDGRLLLASTQDGQVWLWSLDDNAPPTPLTDKQHSQTFQVSFSKDSKHIATAGGDGALRLWSTKAISEPPSVLRGHSGPVFSLQFSPDGGNLVSASPVDGTIRIWSLQGALHSDVSRPSNAPVEAELSRPLEAVRATAEGYTVVAYNGAHEHLALFGPNDQTTPLTEWGGRINIAWQSIAFQKRNASDNDAGPDSIVASSTDGRTFSWPFFKSVNDLTTFAEAHLPLRGSTKPQLSDSQLCKLGLPPKIRCVREDDDN